MIKKIVVAFLWVVLLPCRLLKRLVEGVFGGRWRFGKIKSAGVGAIDALSGIEYEEFVKLLFEVFGCECELTKQSGDYGADIIAKYKKKVLVIQAKLFYTKAVGNAAIQECFSAQSYYDASHALVITNSVFTKSAMQTAEKLKVVLFSRSELIKLFDFDYKRAKNWFLHYVFGEDVG